MPIGRATWLVSSGVAEQQNVLAALDETAVGRLEDERPHQWFFFLSLSLVKSARVSDLERRVGAAGASARNGQGVANFLGCEAGGLG
ncbi:MAG TPA: hypothetical protein VGZ06_05555 [Candidatus Cybelea sp.]|jgi:hypothetical protein|nr:hypothetical protein [Candidatus Cybelea sp.]